MSKPPLYEFVPHELREALRWTDRHDAMAQCVVDEFGLSLPRDRELARQLAFIRVEQGAAHFMPFGKYKDQLLEQIFDSDPGYVEWLAGEDWFRTQFPALHAAILDLNADEDDLPSSDNDGEQPRFVETVQQPDRQSEPDIEQMTLPEVQARLRAVTGRSDVDAQYKQRLWQQLDALLRSVPPW